MALGAAICGIAAALVSSQQRTAVRQLTSMETGLELLALERDVGLTANRYVWTTTMHMQVGDRDHEVENTREAFRRRLESARSDLSNRESADGWQTVRHDMLKAVEDALASYEEDRSDGEWISWTDEFLNKFRLVVPTDNLGRWTSLLEAATWVQEVAFVPRDYFDLALARYSTEEELQPVDPELNALHEASLVATRHIVDSHGTRAAEFTPFEDYLPVEPAGRADRETATLVEGIARHPAVRRIEDDTPYLLGLSDNRSFSSVRQLHASIAPMVDDLEARVEEVRLHAAGRLEAAREAAGRRDLAARWAGGIGVALMLLFSAHLYRRRSRVEAHLRRVAERDPLTNVWSRYALFHWAPERLSDPSWAPFALIQIDLDDFKRINDECGHHVGDAALDAFSRACLATIRSSDMVARIGGDEFVVLLYRAANPARRATEIVERLRQRVEEPFDLAGHLRKIHFSAGVATADGPIDLDTLLIEADLGLLEAKRRGRDELQLAGSSARRELAREVERAIERDELYCAFQPQIDLLTGRITGLEALLRWNDPDGREIPAGRIIEEIAWLGQERVWLERAIRDAQRVWERAGDRVDGRIWLNLTGRDVETEARELLKMFSGSVPPEWLGVEVTDPILSSAVDAARGKLWELREAGIAVALDDVGVGRIPVLHLAQLPIDVMKLDRTLISGLDASPRVMAVVKSLARLGDELGLRVIAEGVETLHEEAAVRGLGLRYVQGFRYARPMRLDALDEFLDGWADERMLEISSGGVA